jgi:poly-gamma-glutamate synthesis protein (capsule biosynthesis protein)
VNKQHRILAGLTASVVVIAAAVVIGASHRSGGTGERATSIGTGSTPTAPGPGTATAPATTATAAAAGRGPRGDGQAVTFAFAGDVQFPDEQDTVDPGAVSTGTPDLAQQLAANPKGVLAPIAPVLSHADVAMVNLETAVTDRGDPVPGKVYHFRSSALAFTALKSAGVDVVTMANNHALDYGPVGMQDTFAAIKASKLPVLGIGRDAAEAYRPYRAVVHGQRIAIFAATDWLEPGLVSAWSATDTQPGLAFSIDRTRLVAAVQAARPAVDTLVVFLHWGTEETHCASAEQEDLARTLIAAGADIVVGSHAHRVFGAGHLGNAFVAYGLGNFVYWREDGESGRSGVLLVTATGRDVDAYSWVPARITHGIPQSETGAAAAADVAEWQNRRTCSGLAP